MRESRSPWFTEYGPDTGALPVTEPHPAPIFDTGPHPEPLHLPNVPDGEPQSAAVAVLDVAEPRAPVPEPLPAPAQPTVVPGQYHYVKWWKFVLLTLGVWAVGAAVGVGLYYWWFHSVDKTWVDFSVLVYVLVCMLAALLVSMIAHRPMASATSIALMSAPFASGAAAAALYGMIVFRWYTP